MHDSLLCAKHVVIAPLVQVHAATDLLAAHASSLVPVGHAFGGLLGAFVRC